jgi:outer membrane protein OmpA-like peptidoglycan-associated protein
VKTLVVAVLIALIGLLSTGCAGFGAPAGMPGAAGTSTSGEEALGVVIGRKNPLHEALADAAGGALDEGAVNRYMDSQKRDLQTALGVEISRGEAQVRMLPDNAVEVTVTPQSAFEPGTAVVNQNFVHTLRKVATVVKTYGKSTITVIGVPDSRTTAHTTREDREDLADQRAETVREMLISIGVEPVLVTAHGDPARTGGTEVIIQPLVAGL